MSGSGVSVTPEVLVDNEGIEKELEFGNSYLALLEVIRQLKIMNFHLELMTDDNITTNDIEE